MRNVEMKAASHAVEAQKQALSETADAFRGVHLDPNAHHWDDVGSLSYQKANTLTIDDYRWKTIMMISLVESSSLGMAGNTRYKCQRAAPKTLQPKYQISMLLSAKPTDL